MANPAIIAQAGIQATQAVTQGINSYYTGKFNLENALESLKTYENDLAIRDQQSARQLRRSARLQRARITGQYIQSGVKLEGSPMSVLTEAFNNELEAETARQQSFAETRRNLAVKRAGLQTRRDNLGTAAFLNTTASLLNIGGQAAAASYKE